MKETLSTIAARTGVSIATVSRVLSGQGPKYRISLETCEKVSAEAKRCHYRASIAVQSLRSSKSRIIGLMLPNVTNPYFSELASVILKRVSEKGYTSIVMATTEDTDKVKNCALQLVAGKVDGIIAVPCGDNMALFSQISTESTPVVLIDRYYENTDLPYVTSNNYQGGTLGTNELIKHGHRKIACLQGNSTASTNIERVKGYKDAMAAAGLEENINVVGDGFTVQNGYLETKILLNLPPEERPTAIFALGNNIALGVIKAIKENKMTIPDDISLIAYDGNEYMDYFQPAITRVSQATTDMATLATKLIFEKIETSSSKNPGLRLSSVMVVGESIKQLI